MQGKPGTEITIQNWLGSVICTLLLVAFGVLSYSAVLQKSPTIDEPVESLGGWTQLHLHDFRMNFEHPPLWHYWAALFNGKDAIRFNPEDGSWIAMPAQSVEQLDFAKRTLFQAPGVDGAAFVNRSRFAMLLLSLTLGGLIAVWARLLGGWMSAIIATALFALDPNLIGHGSLVKNDVAMALAMTAVLLAMWRVGKKLTPLNAAALALLTAVALNVKFSAVLIVPMLLLLLAIRIAMPSPWQVGQFEITQRLAKTGICLILIMVIAGISFLGIWACYGFRFNPSSDPRISLNRAGIRDVLLTNQVQSQHPPPLISPFDPALPLARQLESVSQWIDTFHRELESFRAIATQQDAIGNTHGEYAAMIPQGVKLEQDARSLEVVWSRFLDQIPPQQRSEPPMGEQLRVSLAVFNMTTSLEKTTWAIQLYGALAQIPSQSSGGPVAASINSMIDHRILPSGWLNGLLKVYAESRFRGAFLMGNLSGNGWWYYFPLAMLFKTSIAGAIVLGIALAVGIGIVIRRCKEGWSWRDWPLVCLLVPFGVYSISALTSHADIGWRYLIPLYPFMYIAAGLLLEYALRRWRRPFVPALAALALLMLTETLLAWPNYIAFFNFAFEGAQGGFSLLSDSNLDWGQDLPLLAQWQRDHPDVPLALSYFGSATVDPAYYGIKADYLHSGYPDPLVSQNHILAVSATHIQNPYRTGYDAYQRFTPIKILGGTIYLYDLRSQP